MKYMILIYADERAWHELPEAGRAEMYARHLAYGEELAAAGVMRGGAELAPTWSATTLRLENGRVVTTDGPFAETREQLGGYYLIETADLDAALRWAARCPSLQDGAIEVRPLAEHEA